MLKISLQILKISALVYYIYFLNRFRYQKGFSKVFWNTNQQKIMFYRTESIDMCI